MARSATSPLADLTRLISWHRRKLAVLAAMSAAAVGITAATPDPPPTVAVVVAERQLAGGTQLSAGQLAIRQLPETAVPADAITEIEPLLGRTLVAGLTAGSVLTELSVLGDRPAVADGMTMAPLRVADPTVVKLLRIGDRVDVIASTPESGATARVIAEGVRVVTIPQAGEDSGLDPGAADPGTLLMVEVTPDQATVLADAAATSQLSVLLG